MFLFYVADFLAALLLSLGTMHARTAEIAAILIATAVGIGFLYLGTRLIVLSPLAAVEGRIDVRRALRLTSGNFWRLTAAVLMVVIPASLIEGFIAGVIAGTIKHIELGHLPEWARSASYEAHIRKSIVAWQLPIRFLAAMASIPLCCGLASYSYAMFTGRLDPDAARDDAS